RVAGLTEDADKYAFLIKCFERCDIARNSCEAFENAGMPFPQAWRKLEERFYKKRVAFLGHFRKLLDLPKLTTASSSGLMRIIDVVETAIASAKQIAGTNNEGPTAVENGLLVSIVLGKLDEETTERITRRLDPQSIPTWKELRDELDRCSNQIYYEPRRREAPRTDRAQSTCKPERQPRMVLAATTGTSEQDCKAIIPRLFYTERTGSDTSLGHVGTLCPELRVRSAFERVNLIMGKGKCVNCFSGQHPTAQCPSETRCQVCEKKHHTMLHVESPVPRGSCSVLRSRFVPPSTSTSAVLSSMADPRARPVSPPRGVLRSRSVLRSRFVPPSTSTSAVLSSMADPRARPVSPPRGVLRSCSVPRATNFATSPGTLGLGNYVLLATVAVLMQDGMGGWQRIRCLLDSGCQIQAITTTAVK
uniref:Peptidase A2 domain-containing protein n=1 Tax=Anopheles minimus TaxID=112268 RepID=A0A182WMN0_9DIPT